MGGAIPLLDRDDRRLHRSRRRALGRRSGRILHRLALHPVDSRSRRGSVWLAWDAESVVRRCAPAADGGVIKFGDREGLGMLGGLRPEVPQTRVAVVGLGRFGASVARTCHGLGYDVTAIDIQQERVAAAADFATLAAQADGSDEEALLSLGIDRSQVAVVGQGQNIEASISCALILKRIGVPWVIAKAETDLHGEILAKVGADRIVFPESEAGDQVAHSLEIRHHVRYLNLTGTSGVARMEVPVTAVRQTVGQIDVARPGICIILILRANILLPRPTPDTTLLEGDVILVAGLDEAIDAFADS